MVRSSGIGALLGALTLSQLAHGAEPEHRIALRYSAPDACPDDAQLIAAVEGFLGQPLREAREQELAVSVSVLGGAGGFSAKLTFVSARGTEQRFVEDAECNKLAEAAALLVALAIDPDRVQARQAAADGSSVPDPPPAAASAENPEPATPTKSSEPCPPVPRPVVAPERHPFVGLSAFIGSGTLPQVAPGVSADLGARFGSFRAALVGSYWFPSTARRASDAPISIELSLVTAGLRACGTLAAGGWSLLGCAQGNVGRMSGAGQHVDDARSQSALYSDVQALVFAQYAKWQPAPQAGLGLSWAVARPPFGLSRQNVPVETFRPASVAILAYWGLVLGP